jgi:hypothetical protein
MDMSSFSELDFTRYVSEYSRRREARDDLP